MGEPKEVVIVGAGFGGLGCVDVLMQEEHHDIHVTLLDADETLPFGACWQFVWSGRTSMESVKWSFSNLKAAYHPRVTCLFGEEGVVTTVDMDDKFVTLANGNKIRFDCLVMSPGVVSDPTIIPGLEEAGTAFDVCKFEHAYEIRAELDRLVEILKDLPATTTDDNNGCCDERLTIMMCTMRMPYKCPPVLFEIVSLIDDKLRHHNVRDKARLVVTTPVDFPFGGPPAKKYFVGLMNEMNVEYWNFHTVESVEKVSSVRFEGLKSSTRVNFQVTTDAESVKKSTHVDSLFCTMPQRAPNWVLNIPGIKANKLQLIPVNFQTQRLESHSNVYVIGDACHAMFAKLQKAHPKAGTFAFSMGQHVANVIVHQLQGLPDPLPPSRAGICQAEIGRNNKGVRVIPDFSCPLLNPEGKPKFSFEEIDDASGMKIGWVNEFLSRTFDKFDKLTLLE